MAFINLITMTDQKPLFKAPYDIKDVSALFAIVAFVLIIAAIVGNNLFGLFQQNVNFGWFYECKLNCGLEMTKKRSSNDLTVHY